MVSEQSENLTRVTEQIATHVTAYIERHMNREFHVEDLRRYVFDKVDGYVAPASPDRILRALRQKGRINYEVISRSKSLYKGLPVTGQLELFR